MHEVLGFIPSTANRKRKKKILKYTTHVFINGMIRKKDP
jgi:hypothetical protein